MQESNDTNTSMVDQPTKTTLISKIVAPPPKPQMAEKPKMSLITRKSKKAIYAFLLINGRIVPNLSGNGSSKKTAKESLIRNWFALAASIPMDPGVEVTDINTL